MYNFFNTRVIYSSSSFPFPPSRWRARYRRIKEYEKENKKDKKRMRRVETEERVRKALFQCLKGSVLRNVLHVNVVRRSELPTANEPACRSTRAGCMRENDMKVLGARVSNEVHSLLLVVGAMQQNMANCLSLPATATGRENVRHTYRRQPGIQTDYLRAEEHKGRGAMLR
jgi:hypothetical protein